MLLSGAQEYNPVSVGRFLPVHDAEEARSFSEYCVMNDDTDPVTGQTLSGPPDEGHKITTAVPDLTYLRCSIAARLHLPDQFD